MDAISLEDALAGKEPEFEPEPEKVETPEEEPETAEAVEEPEPEEPDEPKGEIEPEPPSGEPSKEVPIAALLDERDKRKALQTELDQLKQSQEEKAEKPDFWENPEAALSSLEEKLEERFNQRLTAGRLELSMQIASGSHEDFDQSLEAFKAAAEQNPALVDQALAQQHPGEYIYKTGLEYRQLEEYGDISTMKQRLESEIRAQIEAEYASKDQATKEKLAAVPSSLTSETSASSPSEKVEGGPMSLEAILNQR